MLTIVTTQIAKISDSQQGGSRSDSKLTLWSSSGALVSIITTLNAAYDVTEGRPWWKVRLTAIGLTVGVAVFIPASLFLVLVGPTLGEHLAGSLRLGPAFKWSWWILQWPVVLALVATGIRLIYYFAPDVEQEWMWITPGSVVATLLWLAVSLAFKLYITYFGTHNETLRHDRRGHRPPDLAVYLRACDSLRRGDEPEIEHVNLWQGHRREGGGGKAPDWQGGAVCGKAEGRGQLPVQPLPITSTAIWTKSWMRPGRFGPVSDDRGGADAAGSHFRRARTRERLGSCVTTQATTQATASASPERYRGFQASGRSFPAVAPVDRPSAVRYVGQVSRRNLDDLRRDDRRFEMAAHRRITGVPPRLPAGTLT